MSTHWTFSNVVFSVFGLGGEALHGISCSTEDYILLQAGEVRGVNMNHYFFFFFTGKEGSSAAPCKTRWVETLRCSTALSFCDS